jgi:hypothetical protein
MLTLSTPLPNISLARNPIPLYLKATDASGAPFRAYGSTATLTNNANLTEDDNVVISWLTTDNTQESIIFTASTSTDEITRLPYSFADCTTVFARHPAIAPHFKVSFSEGLNGENKITIEANDPTFDYQVEFEAVITINNPQQIVSVNKFPNSPKNEPDNYLINVAVFFETTFGAGDWTSVADMELFLDEEGNLPNIDISSILMRECERSVTENPFRYYSRTEPTLSDNIRRFRVEYKESYTGVTPFLKTTPVRWVMNGGVPNRLFLQSNYNFFDDITKATSWLSYVPQRARLVPNQIAFISWFNNGPNKMKVKLRYKITDGAGNPSNVFDAMDYEVPSLRGITFPVSLKALGIDTLYPDAKFIRIVVLSADIVTLNTPLSTERHFVFDHSYARSTRCLGYLNAFGLPETVHCTGDLTKNVEIVRNNYVGVRFDSQSRMAQVQRQTRGNYRVNWIYRVGTLTPEVSEQLAELEISRVLSDLTDGREIALAFKENKFAVSGIMDSGETIHERQIVAVPRIALNNFAPDKLFEGVVEIENVQELGTLGDPIIITTPPTPPTFEIIELGDIQDTDKMMFLRTDADGKFAGFYIVTAGKFMRKTRGIPFAATHHLDAIGIHDENHATQYWKQNSKTGIDVDNEF